MAKLSTHVLDTMHGRPAKGMRIEFHEIGPAGAAKVAEYVTNADGRTDAPPMDAATFRIGRFELRFHVATYFRGLGVALPDPAFLDIVTVPFGIAEPQGSYHVPLLVSPYAYSTYRGS